MENEAEIELPDGKEEFPLGSGIVNGVIGSGGMAQVYKIWNPQLEVYRAVKILKPSSKQNLRERFQTEVKITAKLHHPNIIEIHNVGEWSGMPFLEMEFIEGASLNEIIDTNGPIPPEACTSIAIMIARGLEYAHTLDIMLYGTVYKGVIHRDLKPQNIMLTKKGLAKIMDFGIARPIETSIHTMEHNIVGTAQYLAPEQLDGKPVDCRTDIYALGAVLYEMLTGTKTFPQDTMTDLVRKKISNEYRRFDTFSVDVPKSIASIVYKCLNKYMADRYSSTRELLNDLESVHKKISKRAPEDFLKTSIENTRIYSNKKEFLNFKVPNKYLEAQKDNVLKWGLINEAQLQQDKKPEESTIKKPVLIGICVAGVIAIALIFGTVIVSGKKENVPVNNNQNEQIQKNAENMQGDGPNEAKKEAGSLEEKPLKKDYSMGEELGKEVASVESKKVDYKDKPSADKGSNLVKKVKPTEIKPVLVNQFAEGKDAYGKGNYEETIIHLSKVRSKDQRYPEAIIMQADAYIETGRTSSAVSLIQESRIEDAAINIVRGKILLKQEKYRNAIDVFQEAIINKSAYRNSEEVRKDALYFSAITYKKILVDNPTKDNQKICKQSWIVVKNLYHEMPNNPRYEKAVLELENLE